MTREEAINVMRGWVLADKDREALETILPELKRDDSKRIKENCIHFLELQKSHHASTVEIDECIDWLKGLVPPKWLYRLEYKDGTCGLWYNGEGKWCFEEGIGSLVGCKTKDLPMDHDERYKQGGRDWFSSCSNKEDLLHWYSLDDAEELIKKGFVFTRYLATEYHEYENETVFIKDSALVREEIDIFELFGKTKPMFKEGDWIIYKDEWTREEDVLRVSNPDPNGTSLYTVKGEQKYYLAWNSLKDAKLWTLEDAKPGDVLVAQYTTFIFKRLKPKGKDNLVEYFVATDKVDGSLLIGPNEYMVKDCEPAIKCQRDHLFGKIKEAGYEWNAKKKELRKIEQKSAEKNVDNRKLCDIVIEELNKYSGNEAYKAPWALDSTGVQYPLYFAELGVKWQKGQKPAWSEEDVAMLDSAISFVEHSPFTTIGKVKGGVVAWLKSLKYRVQPQPKQEWSEEEIENCAREAEDNSCIMLAKHIRQLKSLRPQSRWKPSDEQLYWIKWVADRLPDTEKANEAEAVLKELLEELKKLKN